jgi:hypothetical protein
VRERGSRGTPATAGSSETGKMVKEMLVHCDVHAGEANVITDVAKYAFGKGSSASEPSRRFILVTQR